MINAFHHNFFAPSISSEIFDIIICLVFLMCKLILLQQKNNF